MANIAMAAPAMIPPIAPRVTAGCRGTDAGRVSWGPFRFETTTIENGLETRPPLAFLPSNVPEMSAKEMEGFASFTGFCRREKNTEHPAASSEGVRPETLMADDMKPDVTESSPTEDSRRFTAIVAPELDMLLRAARSLSDNIQDAEDLVQDTLFRAFRSLDRFDGRHPRAWLLTIMRNADHNRHRRRRPTLLRHEETLNAEIDRRNPPSSSAEDVATRPMTAPWVTNALDGLSPRLRQVAHLVDVDGLTYDETAALLDIPAGTVMSRLHRARRQMRTRLERQPDFRSEQ